MMERLLAFMALVAILICAVISNERTIEERKKIKKLQNTQYNPALHFICPDCDGFGGDDMNDCTTCNGIGFIERE